MKISSETKTGLELVDKPLVQAGIDARHRSSSEHNYVARIQAEGVST